jgi:plastocyanin domain-containing protein
VIWYLAFVIGLVAVALYAYRRRTAAASSQAIVRADHTQEARIVVDRGYVPSRIDLEEGVATVLRFERREDDPCTELLVSELWPTQHRLAAHAETLIRFTPQRAGRYAFTCGMGMYSGELVVHERRTN